MKLASVASEIFVLSLAADALSLSVPLGVPSQWFVCGAGALCVVLELRVRRHQHARIQTVGLEASVRKEKSDTEL